MDNRCFYRDDFKDFFKVISKETATLTFYLETGSFISLSLKDFLNTFSLGRTMMPINSSHVISSIALFLDLYISNITMTRSLSVKLIGSRAYKYYQALTFHV